MAKTDIDIYQDLIENIDEMCKTNDVGKLYSLYLKLTQNCRDFHQVNLDRIAKNEEEKTAEIPDWLLSIYK